MTISQWPTFVGIFEMLTCVLVYARWRFLMLLQKPESHDKQPS